FSISYDDIAAQNYAELLDFLGLPAMANTNVALRKQNPHGTADKLLDPVGTKRALEDAGLGHYWVD
nr:hypothetical protein [Oceanospirillaceae bacterium]